MAKRYSIHVVGDRSGFIAEHVGLTRDAAFDTYRQLAKDTAESLGEPAEARIITAANQILSAVRYVPGAALT